MAMMLRTGLLADVSVPGDPQGTFGIRDVRNEHRQIVSPEDAQEHPQDRLELPPT